MGFFRRSKAGTPDVEPTLPMPPQGIGAPPPHAYVPAGHWPAPFMPRAAGPLPAAPPGAQLPPSPQGKPSRLRQFKLAILAASGAVAAAGIGVAAMMVYYTIVLPDPLTLRHKERSPVIRILATDGSVLAERGGAHDFMPLDLLPKQVTNAVVATEDRRFYEHWGVDPAGLVRAFFANLRAGRFAQGGSTLTQQLAKNLFLSHDRTIGRKVEELLLALWLELRLAKTDILELYLNRVYFGGGAYGIESAAQRYFEKSARELTLAEAAIIAGLLKAPSKYSPASSPASARLRGLSVIEKMRAAGYIGAADVRRAQVEQVRFAETKPTKEADGVEYAVDFILERMPPLIGAGHAEVVVETTIDAGLQRRAHAIVAKKLNEQGEELAASQSAVVVLDIDGGIRALVGGRSYAESQYNRAVKSRRQPGSAFKPFVYLAALESGLTPDSITHDLPLSIEGWTPRNTNGRFQGAMPLRRALAESVNTVAVRLQFDLGARRVVDVARRLGIRSELREDPSLALGTSELSLLELTGAYGAFANGGSGIIPHAIKRVRMSSGRVLFARGATRTDQVVAPVHVGALNDMLNSALVSGTGRRAALARHPAAGKTGTTSDFRDAVFVGYTAHFVGGVWSGNDNGKPMNKVTGGGLPAEIWREVMLAAHAGKAPLALPGTSRVALPADARPDKDAPPEVLPWRRPRPSQPEAPVARAKEGTGTASVPAPAAPQPGSEAASTPARRLLPPLVRVTPPAVAKAPGNPPASPVPPRPAAQAASAPQRHAHPKERIDADFIARAIGGDAKSEPQAPALAGVPAGFDVDAIKSRLKAPPNGTTQPAGMMTLGAPAQ